MLITALSISLGCYYFKEYSPISFPPEMSCRLVYVSEKRSCRGRILTWKFKNWLVCRRSKRQRRRLCRLYSWVRPGLGSADLITEELGSSVIFSGFGVDSATTPQFLHSLLSPRPLKCISLHLLSASLIHTVKCHLLYNFVAVGAVPTQTVNGILWPALPQYNAYGICELHGGMWGIGRQ